MASHRDHRITELALVSMATTSALTLAVFLVGLGLYLLLWPVPFQPVAFRPAEPPPLTNQYAVNHRLTGVQRVGPVGAGPEDIALDAEGRLYTGLNDGRIMRAGTDGSNPEVFAHTEGRPLGMAFSRTGNLIVADAKKGLLSIEPNGSITVLAQQADHRPIIFANNLDVGTDGHVYFSDSSIYPLGQFTSDWMDGQPHGRLLVYDPQTKTARVLLDGLYLANGVALGPNESYVLVTETLAYRVTRYWLSGSRQGQREVFIDNLPGFPDNISFNGRDTFWLALLWPRTSRFETLQASPFLRRILLRLPTRLVPRPQLKPYGLVLGIDLDGNVVANLQDPSGTHASYVSGVKEHHGMLFLGTIGEDSIKRIPVPVP